MPEWLLALEASDLTALLRSSVWADALLQIAHLAGLAMVVGGSGIFDLRLLGNGATIPLDALARLALRWAAVGFGLSALSGVLLFMESPIELYLNPAFRLKMALLVVAGVNAFVFHRFVEKRATQGSPRAARLSALVSLGVWACVLVLGSLIAYV